MSVKSSQIYITVLVNNPMGCQVNFRNIVVMY